MSRSRRTGRLAEGEGAKEGHAIGGALGHLPAQFALAVAVDAHPASWRGGRGPGCTRG